MIIFDLDGTLANIDHRRHFIDPFLNENIQLFISETTSLGSAIWGHRNRFTGQIWSPDWEAFDEACYNDVRNEPICNVWDLLATQFPRKRMQIWCGRSEVFRGITLHWLSINLRGWRSNLIRGSCDLKMRPIGDSSRDVELKQAWVEDLIVRKEKIEMVFDDCKNTAEMYHRNGITCLHVNNGWRRNETDAL